MVSGELRTSSEENILREENGRFEDEIEKLDHEKNADSEEKAKREAPVPVSFFHPSLNQVRKEVISLWARTGVYSGSHR